jgi:hypothetical protein
MQNHDMRFQDFRPFPKAVFEGFSVWTTATSVASPNEALASR